MRAVRHGPGRVPRPGVARDGRTDRTALRVGVEHTSLARQRPGVPARRPRRPVRARPRPLGRLESAAATGRPGPRLSRGGRAVARAARRARVARPPGAADRAGGQRMAGRWQKLRCSCAGMPGLGSGTPGAGRRYRRCSLARARRVPCPRGDCYRVRQRWTTLAAADAGIAHNPGGARAVRFRPRSARRTSRPAGLCGERQPRRPRCAAGPGAGAGCGSWLGPPASGADRG